MNPKTYCNPLPLPNYSKGVLVGYSGNDYRETADPSVIYDNGVWYLYASGHLAYKSTDFVNWEYVPVNPEKAGFAPTVVRHKDKYLLTASVFTSPYGTTDLYISDSPLGPFERIGPFLTETGTPLAVCDPMLFSDDDGSLYLYYGGGNDGIYGVRLRDDDWRCFEHPAKNLIWYDPSHEWERNGDYHENDRICWLEGGWMYKKNGTYYLVYCAPGTEFSSYALGAYKSREPLGSFKYQQNNPFLTNETYGKLIRGCGHGCVTDGPNDSIWAFYTSTIGQLHQCERIIGMDKLYIDDNGDLASYGTSETPQPAPGQQIPQTLRYYPLSVRKSQHATSELPGRECINATEENLFCRWVPAPEDCQPTLTIELKREYILRSARVIFTDEGLDFSAGKLPSPRRYIIEGRDFLTKEWVILADYSDNKTEYMIQYHEFPEEKEILADAVRLTLYPDPNASVGTGVRNFTVFGTP